MRERFGMRRKWQWRKETQRRPCCLQVGASPPCAFPLDFTLQVDEKLALISLPPES